ncbi:MAG: RnfABCDGE type electron transport complex subunit D [Halobacteriovoraceae bacterium]|nr:RnfABCDGE type electron transport complex subunit D [Halobacteriovoraceae bacterium]
MIHTILKSDIRIFQIIVMSLLLGTGVFVYDFTLNYQQVALTFIAGILSQIFWIHHLGLNKSSLLSAVITCLGLALLLRANSLWVHPLVSVIAISSKFWFQVSKKHFFNPSAFGIVLALLFFPNTWLSPGQWGSTTSSGIWLAAIGCLIASRAKRIDISWLYLFFYLGGLFIRNLYLGYEIEIFWHSASSGSLLLFAFFMISDPKTSPDHIFGKIILALIIATLSLFMQYYLYITNGHIYALIGTSFFVPLLNKWIQAESFKWRNNEDFRVSNNHLNVHS